MNMFGPMLLATILCIIACQDSASNSEALKIPALNISKENESNSKVQDLNLTENKIPESSTESLTDSKVLQSNETWNLTKPEQKRGIENDTLNDIKPFLLFPILPFLFPKENEEGPWNDISKPKNSSKVVNASAEGKPFILFDFAFNIREIPLENKTEILDGSNAKNAVSQPVAEDPKKNPRRRRNAGSKKETSGLFDDFSFFPDSEIEEFFPKPEMFFPDLPFPSKPIKKLSRRKRNMIKPDLPSDIKMFMDAFDEAFMGTKKEFERSDPIMNFLRGAERSFEGDKGGDDFFGDFLPLTDKRNGKLGSAGNAKRRTDVSRGAPDAPMIIVDKVVKIGEFHVHDDAHDKGKQKKKRDMKFFHAGEGERGKQIKSEIDPGNILQLLKQDNRKKKRSQEELLKEESKTYAKIESKEIKVLPENSSVLIIGNNGTVERKKKEADAGNFSAESSKVHYEKLSLQKPHYDDLKKNVTEVLKRFLAFVKNLDETKLLDKREEGEVEDARFDWTEKETLQNGNVFGKGTRDKRQKKNMDFEEEYVELEKKERQVADLNYLFLTVTLPTIFIFALLLLICFFNLQVKGKICTKLFKPRQVFLVEDETPTRLPAKTMTRTKNPQPI